MPIVEQLIIRDLGPQSYAPTLQAMQNFTASRDASTVDEIWVLEHEPPDGDR